MLLWKLAISLYNRSVTIFSNTWRRVRKIVRHSTKRRVGIATRHVPGKNEKNNQPAFLAEDLKIQEAAI